MATATGYTKKSLHTQESQNAVWHVRVATALLSIYSLISEAAETDEKGNSVLAFYFYKITQDSTKAVLEGTALHSRIRIAFPDSTIEDMLRIARFRAVAEQGIFIRGIDGTRMAGLTRHGLKMLCTKAGLQRGQAEKRSNSRDFLISEMVFGKDEIVFAMKNDPDGTLLVDGVFSGKYSDRGGTEMTEICGMFSETPGFGGDRLSFYSWEEDDGIIEVRMEYEKSPFVIGGQTYMPGIRVKDSRTGKCSFTVQATIRREGTDDFLILAEKKVRHDTRQDIRKLCAAWKEEMDTAIAAYIIRARMEMGQDEGLERVRRRIEETDLSSIVGKKRMNGCHTLMRGRKYDPGCASTLSCAFMLQDYFSSGKEMGTLQKERVRKAMGGILW